MLTMLRNLLRTKAAGLLFVVLIVAMAAWGFTDMFGGGSSQNVMTAGSRIVTVSDFDRTVERVLRNATDDRGRALTKEQALEQGLIDQVMQREQFELVMAAYGDKLGLRTPESEIDNTIRTQPMFQDATGLYDPQLFAALLQNNGITIKEYRDAIENEKTVERLQSLPIQALKVPASIARLQVAYTREQRTASFFPLRQSALQPIGEPSEEQLRELFETRQELLREPERRAISVLRLSPDDYISKVEVLDEDIVAFYEAYKAERYTGPDSRRFTEFSFADETTARAALGRIGAGGAAETALATEERTGRKDIILNTRLADQVFGAGTLPGSIHGPQPVGDLFQVIRLEEVITGDVTPLAAVYEDIRSEIARQQAVGLFYDALPRFDDLIGTGADLETIADGLGVPVLSFAPVDANGISATGSRYTVLLQSPELLQRAFTRGVGERTERLGDDETTWMGRIDTIVAERIPEFEDVREDLAMAWRLQQESEQLARIAGEVEAAISSGESTLSEEAAKYGAVVQDLPRPVTRLDRDIPLPPQLINGLFSANNPGDVLSANGLPGEMLVMQVTNIIRPAPETLDLLAEMSSLDIQDDLAQDLFEAFLGSIQDEVKLKANRSAFEAYKQSLRAEQ